MRFKDRTYVSAILLYSSYIIALKLYFTMEHVLSFLFEIFQCGTGQCHTKSAALRLIGNLCCTIQYFICTCELRYYFCILKVWN
ncbi:hypothetical protein FKM82_007058 [Ascaphus truei]